MAEVIELPAIRVEQSRGKFLYTFGIDGKRLGEIATVSRVRRDKRARLAGYQRPEVVSHISEIRRYIESDHPMIPNAVVVAFDDRVTFQSVGSRSQDGHSHVGVLRIPVDATSDEWDRPGWIVDGQQRLAAVRDAAVRAFPLVVVGFIAKNDREQREQFILVNSTKPLPKGLIYELLPTTDARLSSGLERRRFPAQLLDMLNHSPDSPLAGMIHTPTSPDGLIKDNSILRMLENSLSDGALYSLSLTNRAKATETRRMVEVVGSFWKAVAATWPEAWALPPRQSRLMHGVGIISLGFVMDASFELVGDPASVSQDTFAGDLAHLKETCRWTGGTWKLGNGVVRKWNELQNTSGDIQLVADYLLSQFRIRVVRSKVGAGATS
jgi:DGQHR domain-containing protein